MATGGTDGHVRVWNFPQLTKKFDMFGHTKEVKYLTVFIKFAYFNFINVPVGRFGL
jgi:hypothetical protein